jgi:PKD repeat protein
MILSFTAVYGALEPRGLKCSGAGTDVLLVNGISWSRDTVEYILHKQIKPSVPKSYLDSKSPAGIFVSFKYSYNHTDSFARDILESAIQKLTQNFKIPLSTAYVYAYHYLYRGIVAIDFLESILNQNNPNKTLLFSNAVNFLNSSFQSQDQLIEKAMLDAFRNNIGDTKDLKKSISATLLSGKKLILITESQGNFFARQAILDFKNGERLNNEIRTGIFDNFEEHVGQLQIAPPTGSLLANKKVVLNDRDIINLIFFERPDSNFTLTPPSPDLRSNEIDKFANHFITSTYLNDENMTTGNLSQLREFTLQQLVNVAATLHSTCPKANISFATNYLQVKFNSTNPDNPDVKGFIYKWDFGDGSKFETDNKKISHNYAVPGIYTVTLEIVTPWGVSAFTSVKVEAIAPPPPVHAFINYTKTNLTVNFLANQNFPNETGFDYLWTFENGSTSDARNPSYTYAQAGQYTVSLKVSDAFGNFLITEAVIVVTAPTTPPLIYPVTISYSAQNLRLFFLGSGGPVGATFRWDFGDNSTETTSEFTITHDYATNGIYTVTLEVLDQSGNVVGSGTLNAVALDPEIRILSSPPSIVVPGSFITYKVQCDIGETVEMDSNFTYDFFTNDFNSIGITDFITDCTGLGEQGYGESTGSSIHDVTCRVRTFTETNFYSFIVANNLNISEEPVGVCNYTSNIRFYASFSCTVIDPVTDEKYRSKQLTANPIDIHFSAPATCPPKTGE